MSDNYIITENGELYHHGIKGMRWGVRRYRNADGTLTAAGEKRYAKAERREAIKKSKHDLKELKRPTPNAIRGAAKVAAGAVLAERIRTIYFTRSARQHFASADLGEKIASASVGAVFGAMTVATLKSGYNDIKGSTK
mgnify:CR=1 FL=1